MGYILDGSTIRRPHQVSEQNSTQMAVARTLDGTIRRDLFGANKRTWQLDYRNVKPEDYAVIRAIYDSYLSNASTKTWAITETAYDVAQTLVHVDLIERGFTVAGTSYLSDFSLVLTEA